MHTCRSLGAPLYSEAVPVAILRVVHRAELEQQTKEGAQTAEKLANVQFELDERTLVSQQMQADLTAAQVL